jgi:hypothetical protein
MKPRLKEVMFDELNNYGLPKGQDSTKESMNLNFMLDEDDDEQIDLEINDMFRDKTPEELFKQFQKSRGVVELV